MTFATLRGFEAAAVERLTLATPTTIFDPFAPDGRDLLDPGHLADPEAPQAKPAAVLIPVVARSAPTVLLTQRAVNLSSHAGQIAFPGGKIDAADASPLAAALREAEEEIGLDRALIQPLGYLQPFLTRTGYSIVPVVSLVRPEFSLTLNPGEVTEVFEVPLSFLMDPANHQRQSREWQGRRRYFYAMPFGDRYIWGITAGILRNLWERLSAPVPPAGEE